MIWISRAACIACLAMQASAQPILSFDRQAQTVRVSGLAPDVIAAIARRQPKDISPGFGVYFEDATTPMLGDYELAGDVVVFTPRFPLVPGKRHRAVLDPRMLRASLGLANGGPSEVQKLSFEIDSAEPRPAAHVEAVFPSGDTVPANLLRIYVLFSQPMSRKGIAAYIHLLDDSGAEVEHAFLGMEDGLWDPEGRRLTVFLDPGRIKRGLGLHESMGAPLQPGRRYSLAISGDFRDADRLPIEQGFRKEFRVGPEDRTRPDISKWERRVPEAGGRAELVVIADKPMDEPLFQRLLRVEHTDGRAVRGEVAIHNGGKQWRFIPDEPWRVGSYKIRVAAELEDLAGNRPTRLFDERAATSGRRAGSEEVEIFFAIQDR